MTGLVYAYNLCSWVLLQRKQISCHSERHQAIRDKGHNGWIAKARKVTKATKGNTGTYVTEATMATKASSATRTHLHLHAHAYARTSRCAHARSHTCTHVTTCA